MIRHATLLLGIILAAVAFFGNFPQLGLAVFALACFMAGWTLAWPCAQADMIGTMIHEEHYELPTFDEDLDGDE